MDTYTIIKIKLETSSSLELVQNLEYNSSKRGIETLEAFLTHKSLHSWLHSGYYDFKYTAVAFYKKLAKVLNISDAEIATELTDQKLYQIELDRFKNSYIFVNTNFKRTSQSIFALALLESHRRIKIQEEDLIFKTDEQILEIVSESIVNHYKKTKGNIGIWGKTVNYIYHYSNKTYLFNTNGQEIENVVVNESKATLKLKGKRIC